MTRRTALKRAGALALALGALEAVGPFSFAPQRVGASIVPSDIQFDISPFLAVPPQTYGSDVRFQMPPVHTVFLTAALERTPTRADQAEMNRVLGLLEQSYPWGATNLVTFVAYGLPYFSRLPGGRAGHLVSRYMPRLASDAGRYVLEEALPGPTDVSPANPRITKFRYNVDVRIERNDMLFTLRGDNPGILADVLAWFGGSNKLRGHAVASPAWDGLIRFTSSRNMFVQMGMPRAVAKQHGLPYANFVQPQSPMWMGFADQQVTGSGPGPGRRVHRAGAVHVPRAEPGRRQQGSVRRRRRPGPAAERESRAALRCPDRAGHRHRRRETPDGAPFLPPALIPRGRRHAHAHPHGRARLRRDGRPRRRRGAQAPVHDIRADRRVLPDPADQPGLARPAGQAQRERERQRPRAIPDRHPPAELPHPPAPSPRLPADRTRLTAACPRRLVAWPACGPG